MEKKFYLFEDSAELAKQLAVDFKNAVEEKAYSSESLTVALSGGHTPKAFFEILAEPPYRDEIPWENVTFFWGDERCVPPDNGESNYKMTNDSLLSHIDIPASNIHRVLGEDPPTNEALRYGKIIEENVATGVYPAGTWGPPEASKLFDNTGDDWRYPCKNLSNDGGSIAIVPST